MNNTLDNKPKINTTPITCYAHFRRERERVNYVEKFNVIFEF